MSKLFDDDRTYTLGDPELELLGTREKLAQWRHRRVGPPFYKIGRKVVYHGIDLNAWVEAQRVDPTSETEPEPRPSDLKASLKQSRQKRAKGRSSRAAQSQAPSQSSLSFGEDEQ